VPSKSKSSARATRFDQPSVEPKTIAVEASQSAARFILLAMVLLLTGCRTSSLHLESTNQRQRFHDDAGPVFVVNPQMQNEYAILKASKIYQLTNQPAGVRRLTLHPVHRFGRCGNPIMLTYLTFGILPGVLPAARVFEYELETDGVRVQYAHSLPLYERISIWESLTFTSDQKMMAKGLAWSTRQRGPYFGVSPLPNPH